MIIRHTDKHLGMIMTILCSLLHSAKQSSYIDRCIPEIDIDTISRSTPYQKSRSNVILFSHDSVDRQTDATKYIIVGLIITHNSHTCDEKYDSSLEKMK